MTLKNLMMTLEEGSRSTCRLPCFSALNMFFSTSLSTLILTIALFLPPHPSRTLFFFSSFPCCFQALTSRVTANNKRIMEKMIEEFVVAKPRLQARKHECNILHLPKQRTKQQSSNPKRGSKGDDEGRRETNQRSCGRRRRVGVVQQRSGSEKQHQQRQWRRRREREEVEQPQPFHSVYQGKIDYNNG